MSGYVKCTTQYKDKEIIYEVLEQDFKINKNSIEFHEDSVPIIGYHGASEGMKANIVIRKGIAGNRYDMGFVKTETGYMPVYVDMDSRNEIPQAIQNKEFTRSYTEKKILSMLKRKRGWKITSNQKQDGKIKIRARTN